METPAPEGFTSVISGPVVSAAIKVTTVDPGIKEPLETVKLTAPADVLFNVVAASPLIKVKIPIPSAPPLSAEIITMVPLWLVVVLLYWSCPLIVRFTVSVVSGFEVSKGLSANTVNWVIISGLIVTLKNIGSARLPAVSTAVQVTFVVALTGKNEPENGEQVGARTPSCVSLALTI